MERVLPLLEETVHVAKRTVETGSVLVKVRVAQREQVIDIPLRREEVVVERVAVNRLVDREAPVRQEGNVTIVPVYEEVVTVLKQLFLKEELRITRRSSVSASQPQTIELRREEVEIAHHPPR